MQPRLISPSPLRPLWLGGEGPGPAGPAAADARVSDAPTPPNRSANYSSPAPLKHAMRPCSRLDCLQIPPDPPNMPLASVLSPAIRGPNPALLSRPSSRSSACFPPFPGSDASNMHVKLRSFAPWTPSKPQKLRGATVSRGASEGADVSARPRIGFIGEGRAPPPLAPTRGLRRVGAPSHRSTVDRQRRGRRAGGHRPGQHRRPRPQGGATWRRP